MTKFQLKNEKSNIFEPLFSINSIDFKYQFYRLVLQSVLFSSVLFFTV